MRLSTLANTTLFPTGAFFFCFGVCQVACRGVLKMRTSAAIQVAGEPSGALAPDPELPGVYRLASCSPGTLPP